MKAKVVLLVFLLAGCSNGGNNAPSNPVPSVGQWVGSPPYPISGNSFQFGSQVAGYFYTQFPAAPNVGQTLTLNYTLTGSNPVLQNHPNGGDSGAPTLHLFLWQKGDNETCAGDYNFYRLFAGRTPLVPGANQVISVPLTGANWSPCFPTAVTDARLQTTLNNLLGAGFTFGGQSFAGHGIYLSSGSATFTINSFTVQ
jgi:hypothetical protein